MSYRDPRYNQDPVPQHTHNNYNNNNNNPAAYSSSYSNGLPPYQDPRQQHLPPHIMNNNYPNNHPNSNHNHNNNNNQYNNHQDQENYPYNHNVGNHHHHNAYHAHQNVPNHYNHDTKPSHHHYDNTGSNHHHRNNYHHDNHSRDYARQDFSSKPYGGGGGHNGGGGYNGDNRHGPRNDYGRGHDNSFNNNYNNNNNYNRGGGDHYGGGGGGGGNSYNGGRGRDSHQRDDRNRDYSHVGFAPQNYINSSNFTINLVNDARYPAPLLVSALKTYGYFEKLKRDLLPTDHYPITQHPLQLCPKMPPGQFGKDSVVPITANMVAMDINFDLLSCVFLYDIQFEPPILDKARKREVFYTLTQILGLLEWMAYDGESMGYSLIPPSAEFRQNAEGEEDAITLDDENDAEVSTGTTTKPGKRFNYTALLAQNRMYNDLGLVSDQANIDGDDEAAAGARVEPQQWVTIRHTTRVNVQTTLLQNYGIKAQDAASVKADGSDYGDDGVKYDELSQVDDFKSLTERVYPIQRALAIVLKHAYVVNSLYRDRAAIFAKNRINVQDRDADQFAVFRCADFVTQASSLYHITDLSKFKSLGNNLFNVTGAYSSLKFLQRGLTLNMDTTSISLYKPGTPLPDLLPRFGKPNKGAYGKFIGFRCITTHLGDKNLTVTLNKVGPLAGQVPSWVDRKSGQQIQFVSNYKNKYNINVNPNCHVYDIRRDDGAPIYFPIEVLQLAREGTKPINTLTPEQTQQKLRMTSQPPVERLGAAWNELKLLNEALQELSKATKRSLQERIYTAENDAAAQSETKQIPDQHVEDSVYDCFTVENNWLQLESRILPPPALVVNDDKGNPQVLPTAHGLVDLSGHNAYRFYHPASYDPETKTNNPIHVIFCHEAGKDGNWNAISKHLFDKANSRGLNLVPATDPRFRDPISLPKQPRRSLDNLLRDVKACRERHLIFCLVGPNSTAYNHLKAMGELEYGVVSQCADAKILDRNLSSDAASYFDNLVLKINVKLGGINYSLWPTRADHNPLLTQAVAHPINNNQQQLNRPAPHHTVSSEVPVCVFGVAYQREKTKKTGALAVVSTYDQALTRYHAWAHQADVDPNQANSETAPSRALQLGTFNLLTQFALHNKNQFPQHIVIYREGMSDSQLTHVMQDEIPAMISAIQQAYIDMHRDSSHQYEPTISYIVGLKRHNARFEPNKNHDDPTSLGRNPKRTNNLPAGTVIDKDVVHSLVTEFYLSSQNSPLGTARPSLYQVIYNTHPHRVTMDDMQLLTNYLSYGLQRCLRSTSSPSALLYAYHLCARSQFYTKAPVDARDRTKAGQWVKKTTVPSLTGSAFFL